MDHLDRHKTRFGVRVSPDATCGHQFVAAKGTDVEWFQQVFMLNMLGVGIELHHRSSTTFAGGVVEHSTAAPLTVFPSGDVMVPSQRNGNCVFAWGGGGGGGPNWRNFANVCNENWTAFKATRGLPQGMALGFFLNFVQQMEAGNFVQHVPGADQLGGADWLTMTGAANAHIACRNAQNNA